MQLQRTMPERKIPWTRGRIGPDQGHQGADNQDNSAGRFGLKVAPEGMDETLCGSGRKQVRPVLQQKVLPLNPQKSLSVTMGRKYPAQAKFVNCTIDPGSSPLRCQTRWSGRTRKCLNFRTLLLLAWMICEASLSCRVSSTDRGYVLCSFFSESNARRNQTQLQAEPPGFTCRSLLQTRIPGCIT